VNTAWPVVYNIVFVALRAAVFLTASLGGCILVQVPCLCCISGHIAKYLYCRIGCHALSLWAGGVLRGRAYFEFLR
jgi:hypothetical protein